MWVVRIAAAALFLASCATTPPLEVGSPAPLFEALSTAGALFKLAERRGKGWTVLYFFPKAFTPG